VSDDLDREIEELLAREETITPEPVTVKWFLGRVLLGFYIGACIFILLGSLWVGLSKVFP
jgi:hypothetical protein